MKNCQHLECRISLLITPLINKERNSNEHRTWVYSRDCQREAAISGDLPKAARQRRSSPLRTGGTLHWSKPSTTTTGVHWGCSHNASRAFSL